MTRKVAQRGFTLIELLIVIVIVGILAAIAIPTYQHYVNKSRATGAVVLVQPAKMAITQYALLHHGHLQDVSNASLHLSSEQLVAHSRNVSAITIQGDSADMATISVTLADQLGVLNWQGTYNAEQGTMSWQCTYPHDSPLQAYAPHQCSPAGGEL